MLVPVPCAGPAVVDGVFGDAIVDEIGKEEEELGEKIDVDVTDVPSRVEVEADKGTLGVEDMAFEEVGVISAGDAVAGV